jgi:hypothetical protein
MPVAEVQFYDVIVWLHIAAVVVGFGPTFAFGLYAVYTQKNHPRMVPAMIDAQGQVIKTMVIAGLVLIPATGIYLTADRWDFGDFFVAWGMAAILALIALVFGFFRPNDERIREAAERDIQSAGSGEVQFGEDYNRHSGLAAKIGPLAGLLVILTIYVMTAKPFL